MSLLIKCIMAVIIMVIVHYISKTNNYYIAGLILSFPGLSIIAYYFMYLEQGASKVRVTTYFAMLSALLEFYPLSLMGMWRYLKIKLTSSKVKQMFNSDIL
ncbi:GlpM protein [Aneurinibacillus soli]|uniref:Inner membrane protein YdgC n=2 Tax=Aneurinibacillus soli TaxID=1500254 RepID=A0A0U5BEQ8_9BACL|nr:GlpM protein [Aneurinibacillus soli]BAU29436.1 Inner membrane protein YdgC [Aneurinibacillus soli]